jgi:glycosyltransferase involved in cell wall biosynthesis
MPVRDAADTLHECIASIREQRFTDYEVIAVDDGSSDESVQHLRQWAEADGRVRVQCQPSLGIVAALNAGLRLARGRYIARMDADDVMHPERLQAQVDYLRHHPQVSLVATQVDLFPRQHVQAGYTEYVRWQNHCISHADIADEIYVESPLAHPSVMFCRQTVQGLGGYREGDFPEDYDLWLRMLQDNCRMAKLPRALLSWRESTQRTSRTDPRYSREAFDYLRAVYLSRDPRINNGRTLVYWGAGRKTRKRSALLIDKGLPPRAWIDIDPRKIGNRIQGARVQSPEWLAGFTGDDKPFVLGYVTNHGARELIGRQLAAMGYQRGQDYLMVG